MSSIEQETLVPCLCCGKKFTAVDSGHTDWHVQPHGGLMFHSSGNFGSRIFDTPLSSAMAGVGTVKLLVLVCDDCIRENLPERVLVEERERVRTTYRYRSVSDVDGLPNV